jgi:site-specific DNA recombinase
MAISKKTPRDLSPTASEKVALYTRVSSQEQATEGTSLEFQHEELTAYCQGKRWEVFREYTDPGYSGKDGNRPELQRLLANAKLNRFKKVVAFKLDRFARNLRLLLELEEQLGKDGVSLYSVKESIDTSTAMGRVVFQILGLVAEWERETIVERTKSGRMQRYKQGCWAAGRPLYGYLYNKKTRKLDVDKTKAPVIRRIFREYADGKSLVQVAHGLMRDKIPPRRTQAKAWDPGAIRDILFNPAYKGTLQVNKYQRTAKTHKVDLTNAITIKIPAIVNEALWQAAQRHRKDNKHRRPMRKQEQWLLQGLVTCGLCGRGFRAYTHNGHPGHRRRVYTCRGRLAYTHLDGSPRCTCPNQDADLLEQQVRQRIEAVVNDPDKLEEVLKDTVDRLRSREAELSAMIRPIDEHLATIAQQKHRLADDWVRLNMDAPQFKKMQQDLDKEESRLRDIRSEIDPKQLEELQQTRTVLGFWERQLKSMLWNLVDEEGHTLGEAGRPYKNVLTIVGLDDKEVGEFLQFPSSRRALLDRLQVRVIVFPDRADIKALFDVEPVESQVCSSV